jgi:DNA-binding IclR family transcriptional regulator
MARPRLDHGAEPNYQVRALQRGLAVLGCFSVARPALTMAQVSGALALPKPTALRLLECLVGERWLSFDVATGTYQLSPRPLEVAAVYLATSSLDQAAQPVLRKLCDRTQQTANLGVLDHDEVLHVAVVEPERPMHYHTRVGARELAHSTGLGKVLLAALPDAALRRVLLRGLPRKTAATLTDEAALVAELALVRQLGYAEDREEAERGLRCLAAPVRDGSGQMVAAISISGAAADFVGDAQPELLEAVLSASTCLSQRLGWVNTR